MAIEGAWGVNIDIIIPRSIAQQCMAALCPDAMESYHVTRGAAARAFGDLMHALAGAADRSRNSDQMARIEEGCAAHPSGLEPRETITVGGVA